MDRKGLIGGWHFLYRNDNPDPSRVCNHCRQFIGYVFHPSEAPPLPMHPHCYCAYQPTPRPVNWPPDDAPDAWDSWDSYFEWLEVNKPADWRIWVQRAAWYLRKLWPLGVLECLREAAERYNEEEYEPRDDEPDHESPRRSPMAFTHHSKTADSEPRSDQQAGSAIKPHLQAHRNALGLAQSDKEANDPSSPQKAPQKASPGAARHDGSGQTQGPALDIDPQKKYTDATHHKATVHHGHVLLQPNSRDDSPHPTYDAILVTPGWIRQDDGQDSNWLIPDHVLQDAVDQGLFSPLPHYVDHPDLFGFGWRQSPSIRDLAGLASDAAWDPDHQAVRAQIRLYDTEAGHLLGSLYDQVIADKAAGKDVPPIGLSISVFREYEHDEDTGNRIWTKINKVSSVDAVYEPGAAGYIRQALSTIRAEPQGGTMPEELNTAQVSAASLPADPEPQEVIQQPVAVAEDNEAPAAQLDTSPTEGAQGGGQRPPAWDHARIQENLATLNAAVDRIHGLLAKQQERNTVEGMGDAPRSPALYGGWTGLDRLEMAVEALLSGTRPPQGVRPLTGIRELYMLLSGDYELTGRFQEDRVYLANVTTSTMAGLVANRLNKIVINMFQSYNQWWAPGVTVRDFNNLQDIRWITLGGVGELPTVAEGAAYSELTWDDQTETDSFVKKGGYLGITLETIDKDDTGRVMAAPRALAQGAWLTLGKAIAEVFTANSGYGPTMSDSNYLIDSSNHSNEGSTALSYDAWKATQIAMMKYTEVNSGERLGALTRPRFLWVPIDLEDTAAELLAAGEGEPGDADYHVNPDAFADGLTARIAAARRRVITVPFWTDTNDWVAQADPNLYPGLGLGFRYGRAPEVFSVADPRAGLMFTNDTMPIKVRFFFAVGPTDWRAWYKHLVT